MTDDRMLHRFSGHTHTRVHETTPVIEHDGVLVTVSADEEGGLWTCDLTGGECVHRPLELAAAGPEDGMEDEVEDDPGEVGRPTFEVDAYHLVSAMTVARLDGRPVAVTGGGRFDLSHDDRWDMLGGAVRVWDLRTGRKIGRTLIGHELGVTSLATVASEQGLIAVSSSEEGTLLAWNLSRGGERVAQLEGGYNGAMGAGLVDGRVIAATGGHDDFVQAWDLFGGERIGGDLTGVKAGVQAIAVTELNGRAVVAAGGGDHALHLWDLDDQKPIGTPMTGHTDSIQTLGTATVDGRAIALTGSDDGTTRVWDLAGGRQIGEPITGHRLQVVTAMAGVPVAVTASHEDGIRVWDLALAVREA